jgi:hypothetical protein
MPSGGDVLYIKDSVTTGLAAINHLKEPFSLLSSVALLKPDRRILHPAFLKHWLNSPEIFARMTADMTGSAIRRLVLRQIRSALILLPSLNEQKRISDKLDAILAQVDACRERLDRVPAILKRFRQAVLAAATSGTLTEEWRVTQEVVTDCRDPQDNKFLALALDGKATHIVSGDEDLLVLYPFRGIPILTPRGFIAHCEGEEQVGQAGDQTSGTS